MIETNTIQKLEREIQQLNQRKLQGSLFENDAYLEELNRDIKLRQEEVDFRKKHYEEIRDQLTRERDRIINRLLPKRFALFSTAQVFPLAIEILLPDPNPKLKSS
jgi:Rad3-related DNA helicase